MRGLDENSNERKELYNQVTGTYHVFNIWEQSQPVTDTVMETVSAVTKTWPEEGDRLYDVVDPDALHDLFQPVSDAVPRNTGGVTFTLNGHDITLYGHGELIIGVHKPPGENLLNHPANE